MIAEKAAQLILKGAATQTYLNEDAIPTLTGSMQHRQLAVTSCRQWNNKNNHCGLRAEDSNDVGLHPRAGCNGKHLQPS